VSKSNSSKTVDSISVSMKKTEKLLKEIEAMEKAGTLQEPTPHTIRKRSKLTLKFWKYFIWWRSSQDKIMLVNMELRNGQHDTVIIKTNGTGFKYKGGSYIIDDEIKYYNIGEALWTLDYHQDCTIPIRRDIPVNQIKKALEASNLSEVEYSTNPSVLERFIISKISEGIMKGQQIDEFLKTLKTWLIVGVLTGMIHLALFVFKTGMLEGIKIPGLS